MDYYQFQALKAKQKKVCKECGKDMILDDIDFRFKGCYDNYFICEHCQTSCTEEIRFNQSFQEHWHSENNDIAKDYSIKHSINFTTVKK